MKRLFQFIAYGFIITIVFVSCSSNTTSNDPNLVLNDFFEHLSKKDIDGASKYVTTASKPTMEMMKKGLSMAEKLKDSLPQNNPLKEFEDVEIEPARIMGDSALINVRSKSGKRPDAEFKLLKESNGWKVDFAMSTLMRMGMKSAQQGDGIITDSTSAILNSKEAQRGMKMADSVLKNMDPKVIDEIQKQLEKLK